MKSRTLQSQSNRWSTQTSRQRVAVACSLIAAAMLWAPSAWAAQVVDVRVGQHADYTRVVFELDSFVGYQIEQHGSAVVIQLDATAQPALIKPSKGLIESLEIAESGSKSAAHLELTRGGLKLKEMTLANPPRIVIDVLTPGTAPVLSTKTAAPSVPTPAVDLTSTAEESTPTPVQETGKTAIAAIAARTAVEEAPAAPIQVAETQDPIAAPAIRQSTPIASTAPSPPAVPSARRVELAPAAKQLARPIGQAAPQNLAGTTASPAAPTAETEESAFGGATLWVAGGVGAVLLVAAGIVISRRRGGSEFDEEEFESGLEEANPFADLTPDSNESMPSFAQPAELTGSSPAAPEVQATQAANPDEATEPVPFGQVVEPLTALQPEADESSEATEPVPFGQPVDMGVTDRAETVVVDNSDERKPLAPPIVAGADDLPLLHGTQLPEDGAEPLAGAIVDSGPSLPVAGVGSVDVGLLLKEIERRVSGIESRIDEIADGRERIDQQVAAQTEELRVQRAAIARTQRAVRNLSRPDDAAPTEPALRDPKAPEGPREG